MIRTALVIGRLNVGGAEAELIRLANRLDRAKFLPFIVTLQDAGPLLHEVRGAEIFSLGKKKKWSIGTYRALRGMLRDLKPDLVQSFLFTENVFCRRIGQGIVVSGLQGSLSDDYETGPSMKLSLERWTWGRAQAVVSNSEFYREHYRSLGLDVSRVAVIPSAVEPREAKPAGIRASLGVRADEVLVTCVARLVERKGHEDLIRAAAGLRLLFVGDGPHRPHLEGRGAILAGWRQDIPEVLAATDIVALASRFGEGCPNAVLEAMAAGKPVVATRAGGTAEAVVDGETGILVRPGDTDALGAALRRLAGDPDLRRRMGEAGRARARERFGVDAMVKAYEALYFTLTAGRPPV